MNVFCPICNSNKVEEIEKIFTSDLAKLFKEFVGESILDEFKGHSEIIFFHCKDCDLSYFHPAITGSEEFYEKLQKNEWYYLEDKYEYGVAAQYISENVRVLNRFTNRMNPIFFSQHPGLLTEL